MWTFVAYTMPKWLTYSYKWNTNIQFKNICREIEKIVYHTSVRFCSFSAMQNALEIIATVHSEGGARPWRQWSQCMVEVGTVHDGSGASTWWQCCQHMVAVRAHLVWQSKSIPACPLAGTCPSSACNVWFDADSTVWGKCVAATNQFGVNYCLQRIFSRWTHFSFTSFLRDQLSSPAHFGVPTFRCWRIVALVRYALAFSYCGDRPQCVLATAYNDPATVHRSCITSLAFHIINALRDGPIASLQHYDSGTIHRRCITSTVHYIPGALWRQGITSSGHNSAYAFHRWLWCITWLADYDVEELWCWGLAASTNYGSDGLRYPSFMALVH